MNLSALLSPNTTIRSSAETSFKFLQTQHPASTSFSLLSSPCSSEAERTLSLVLLRQTVRLKWDEEEPRKFELAQALLGLIEGGSLQGKTPGAAIDAFAALGQDVLRTFGERVVSIGAGMCAGGDAMTGLQLMDAYAEFGFSEQIAKPFAQTLAGVISSAQTPVQVKLRAGRAGVSLVLAAQEENPEHEEQSIRELGASLPGIVIRNIALAMANPDVEEDMERAMESLSSLADSCGWALDGNLAENCSMLLEICENKDVSESIKALAMTVFGSVMARRGASASRDAAFSARAMKCIVKMQTQDDAFDDDFDVLASPDDDDMLGASRGGLRGSALDSLMQLASASSGSAADSKTLLTTLFQVVRPALGSEDWRLRVAALSSVSIVVGPASKAFKPFLADVVGGACKMLLEDPHPRVRAAASLCVYSVVTASKKFAKEIRKTMANIVVPALASSLVQNESRDTPFAKCACLMALSAFYGGKSRRMGIAGEDGGDAEQDDNEDGSGAVKVPKAALQPYLDGLVQTLIHVLGGTSAHSCVQIRSMDALSVLAERASTGFGKFYDSLIPGVKQAFSTAQDSVLKHSAMMLIATVAETVGKEKFARDATDVVSMFLQAHRNASASANGYEETQELQGLFEFCSRVSNVLQREFAPFLPHVLPLAVSAATADLKISVTDAAATTPMGSSLVNADEESGQATAVAKLRGVGNFQISANVFAFQLRESALQFLDDLSENDCLFNPQDLIAVSQAVLPNISDRACTSAVNSVAADCAGSLFHSACRTGDAACATRLLVSLATELLTGLAYESNSPCSTEEVDRRRSFGSAFERMMRVCWLSTAGSSPTEEIKLVPVKPPQELMPKMIQVLIDAITLSLVRRTNGVQELRAQGFERETIAEFEADIAEDEVEFASELVDALGYMLKTDAVAAWPAYREKVLPFMVNFIDVEVQGDKSMTHNALCSFVDALEFMSEFDQRVAEACVPNLKKALFSQDPLLRQVAGYGCGVCITKIPPQIAVGGSMEWPDILGQAMIRCLRLTDAHGEDGTMTLATENVASSLGKLFLRTGKIEYLQAFIKELPLMEDAEEAPLSHALLFRLVLENKIMDQDPIVLKVCVAIADRRLKLHDEEEDDVVDLCDDATFAQLPAVMRIVRQRAGDEVAFLNLMLNSLNSLKDAIDERAVKELMAL